MRTRTRGRAALLALIVATGLRAGAQSETADWEWPTRGADLANTRYAPLDQIDAANFEDLELAWRFGTHNLGPRPDYRWQTTPLVAGGVMYTTAGSRRAVVALDAASGELLWVHRMDEGRRGELATRGGSGRGVAYWTDGGRQRIFYITPGYRLVALDARTGVRIPSFGVEGIVDLRLEMDQPLDVVTGDVSLRTPPVVAGNTIIVGASHAPGQVPGSRSAPKGHVRAYDALTGERLWIFHTIPAAGEFGADTWLNDSRVYTGHTGVWAQITVDLELGLAYLPIETPTGDHYGGHRPGDNLFSDSLVAVDLETGERVWHYQFVHHDIWDYDLPCGPILADITVDGRTVKAVAQPTKQSWLYVFDRATGEPVWPIEERPVEAGDVPGEWYAPTQPFPTRPPAYDRQGVAIDDLIDFTPELRAQAVEIASRYKLGPIFTPPVVSRAEGLLGTLTLPNIAGGSNWPGGSLDPETGIVYLATRTSMMSLALVEPNAATSDMSFVVGTAAAQAGGQDGATPIPVTGLRVDGLPLAKPPYGRITAIDLHRGDILWQVPHGETPDVVRNHPALQGLDIPRTGSSGGGTLVTQTLLIAGDDSTFTAPDGSRAAMLRAYDKSSGAEVGTLQLPAAVTGLPMTYTIGGVQYITLAVGGAGHAAELLTFRLPS